MIKSFKRISVLISDYIITWTYYEWAIDEAVPLIITYGPQTGAKKPLENILSNQFQQDMKLDIIQLPVLLNNAISRRV